MILTATLQCSFESYGTGSISCPHMLLPFLLFCSQSTIDLLYLTVLLSCLYFLTFTPFGSNNFSCWTRDDRNSFGCVTLAIDHHSFGSTVVRAIFGDSHWVTFIALQAPHFTNVPHLIWFSLSLVPNEIKSCLSHKCCPQLISIVTLGKTQFILPVGCSLKASSLRLH